MRRPCNLLVIGTVALLSACTAPLSQQLTGQKYPAAASATGPDVALISFSADKKYESEKGVPFEGDPLVCASQKVFRVNDEASELNQVAVKPGEEIAVTSVIAWTNTGFRKVCGPFVSFIPESGAKYIVVNERIGGKGVSAMWTGMAFQTCEVSVYKEQGGKAMRIAARKTVDTACRASGQ